MGWVGAEAVIRSLALALLLAGCASTFETPMPARRAMLIAIDPRADLPHGVDGLATWSDDICLVRLRAYPRCLGHEIRHCFEGDWHSGRMSYEDC